ncbi:MAG TPA: hypothetical protein DIT58_14100, partial [Porticoccaceae bacterium]|nr:hypothetical protein [Porticoccaceae bacterium]
KAQQPATEEVRDATHIAQAAQQGSGQTRSDKDRITTDRKADYSAEVLREADTWQPPATRMASPDSSERVLTTSEANRRILEQKAIVGERTVGQSDQDITPKVVKDISSMDAQLDTERLTQSTEPNILRLTSASTRQADHATYLKYWIDKVEATGNQHYPPEARSRGLFGELQLAVTILPDGTVESVKIVRSSNHTLLDQAAVETVRLAAPFQAFPREMRDWNKIEIVQTWRFSPDQSMRTQ